jgi:6-phosphofructokinase 1
MKARIDILYVIGGDGTMKAAHALHEVARKNPERERLNRKLSVVSIPKTMDNDVLWVWQSFGFLSAVEKGREVIEHLSTEVESNPRLCVVQLFGSDSGFVVSHAVLASSTGHCVAALIPEVDFSMKGEHGLIAHVRRVLQKQDPRPPHGIIVMAETAIPQDAQDYIDDPDIGLTSIPDGERLTQIRDALAEKEELRRYLELRGKKKRIQGQTEDALRSAGLKIVSRGLLKGLADGDDDAGPSEDWKRLRAFTNEPRHLLRAIPPSCLDIIIGQRLGTLAVDNAMAGFTDFMISQWLTEYVLVPLRLVVLGRKRIPESGMFWKSVLAKTGQPAVMVDNK